jgi:Cu+-exporting ATPase
MATMTMFPQSASLRSATWGTFALLAMMGIYFGTLTLVSGWNFTVEQFSEFWYFIFALAGGFGLQVALYTRLRQLVAGSTESKTVMAASGTTSTAAMISCCAHYLTNVAPILGATGLVTLASQYQVELFWVGLAFNAAGIAYIGGKLARVLKEHAQCATA